MDNDEILIRSALNGNMNDFEELIKKYEKLIYSISYRMFNSAEDAKDIGQEVFIKIYKNMEKCIGKGSFKSWVCTVTTNACIDEIRKRKRKPILSIDESINYKGDSITRDIIDDEPEPLEQIVKVESENILKEAINKLPEDYKSIIILREIENYSYDEISEILEINVGTVKSRISRGRKKLRDIYILDKELYENRNV